MRAEHRAPEIPEPVTFALRAVWASAWCSAQEGVAGEREALEKARREMAGEQQAMGLWISLRAERDGDSDTPPLPLRGGRKGATRQGEQ